MSREAALTAAILRRSAWAPATVLAAHVVLNALQLYQRFPDLDIPMHFVGGLAVAHVTARAVDVGREAGVVRLGPVLLEKLLIIACTALAAVLWELHELVLDTLAGTRELGDLADTLGDLFFGLLGGTVYAALRRGGNRAGGPE
ncbi:MAG: hypothetical protein PVF91_08805 [Chromatiales bacterium]|jgi:hypothetical protein